MDLKGWPDMSLSCVFSLSKKLYIFPSEREVRICHGWLNLQVRITNSLLNKPHRVFRCFSLVKQTLVISIACSQSNSMIPNKHFVRWNFFKPFITLRSLMVDLTCRKYWYIDLVTTAELLVNTGMQSYLKARSFPSKISDRSV